MQIQTQPVSCQPLTRRSQQEAELWSPCLHTALRLVSASKLHTLRLGDTYITSFSAPNTQLKLSSQKKSQSCSKEASTLASWKVFRQWSDTATKKNHGNFLQLLFHKNDFFPPLWLGGFLFLFAFTQSICCFERGIMKNPASQESSVLLSCFITAEKPSDPKNKLNHPNVSMLILHRQH